MSQFLLFPPRAHRRRGPFLASVLLHGTVVAALIVKQRWILPEPVPVLDEIARFFLPPDQQRGLQSAGAEIDWSGVVERGSQADLPPQPAAEAPTPAALPAGRSGTPEPEGPPASATALVAEGGDRQGEEETALTEVEVDSAVVRDPTSAAPVYPAALLTRNIEGSAYIEYVVDTTGLVDTTTIRVLRATHPEFAQAAREALAAMKFRPALHAGTRVRQWVQQNFAFWIIPPRVPPLQLR